MAMKWEYLLHGCSGWRRTDTESELLEVHCRSWTQEYSCDILFYSILSDLVLHSKREDRLLQESLDRNRNHQVTARYFPENLMAMAACAESPERFGLLMRQFEFDKVTSGSDVLVWKRFTSWRRAAVMDYPESQNCWLIESKTSRCFPELFWYISHMIYCLWLHLFRFERLRILSQYWSEAWRLLTAKQLVMLMLTSGYVEVAATIFLVQTLLSFNAITLRKGAHTILVWDRSKRQIQCYSRSFKDDASYSASSKLCTRHDNLKTKSTHLSQKTCTGSKMEKKRAGNRGPYLIHSKRKISRRFGLSRIALVEQEPLIFASSRAVRWSDLEVFFSYVWSTDQKVVWSTWQGRRRLTTISIISQSPHTSNADDFQIRQSTEFENGLVTMVQSIWCCQNWPSQANPIKHSVTPTKAEQPSYHQCWSSAYNLGISSIKAILIPTSRLLSLFPNVKFVKPIFGFLSPEIEMSNGHYPQWGRLKIGDGHD